MKQRKLGIDIGGVISDKLTDGKSSKLNFADTAPIEGAVECIERLVTAFGNDNVFLVSKCGYVMQRRTRQWLRAIDFHQQTGIRADQVWFCKERREKAEICDVLSITDFVDDRLEILGYLSTVRTKILFRPNPREVERYSSSLPHVTRVENWPDAEGAIFRAF